MVMNAPRSGGGTPHFLVVFQFLGEVSQIGRNLFVPQGEEFIVGRVKNLLEAGFVEGGFAGHHFFARLLDLHQDGNDEKDQDNARSNSNDRPVSFRDLFE